MIPATKLYAITDCQLSNCTHEEIAIHLLAGGAQWIQLRDKEASAKEILEAAHTCLALTRVAGAKLIINDRVDVALAAGADGVHLGQDDMEVEEARQILGLDKIIGISTHTIAQVRRALDTTANYIAIGPIYQTTTKENPAPTVGLQLLRQARELTVRPLVAIGGITLERAPEVIAAGADSVAVISALYPFTEIRDFTSKPDITGRTRAFLQRLGNGDERLE